MARAPPWRTHLAAQVAKWRGRVVLGEADRDLGLPSALARAELRATGLLDFAAAMLGDPLYDLAKMAWNDPGSDVDALLAGWSQRLGVTVDRARFHPYEAVQGLAAVAWADRHAGHDDFRRRGREVVLRRVA